jgi:hypothetical protein
VKKSAVILLLATYFIAFTEAKELVKIPALIAHFYGHEKSDKQSGLLELLALHYGNKAHADNDDEQDKQLPFKNTENDLVYPPLISPNNAKYIFILPLQLTGIVPYKSSLPTLHIHDFWQPPRQPYSA